MTTAAPDDAWRRARGPLARPGLRGGVRRLAAAWVERARRRSSTLFVVVDENVLRLHGDGRPGAAARCPESSSLPIAEERKVYRRPSPSSADSATAAGGEAELPSSSRSAAASRRTSPGSWRPCCIGVSRWVYVPTTLLAMADSCIGGKTSLNLGVTKNLLGTIYPPDRVIVHAPFVDTLAEMTSRAGSARSSSSTCSGAPAARSELRATLPALMSRETSGVRRATRTSLEIKRDFIEEDEFDRGRRNLLNYGHCFGHALEAATDFAVPHGLAVVVGMRARGPRGLPSRAADPASRRRHAGARCTNPSFPHGRCWTQPHEAHSSRRWPTTRSAPGQASL